MAIDKTEQRSKERQNMVYKIPEKLFGKYDGSGYAFAEIINDEIINFVYLRNVNEFAEALETDHARFFVRTWLKTEEAKPYADFTFGMISAYDFIEL